MWGPLTREQAHEDGVEALALAEQAGEPLLLSGSWDGVILAHRIVSG